MPDNRPARIGTDTMIAIGEVVTVRQSDHQPGDYVTLLFGQHEYGVGLYITPTTVKRVS